MMNVVSLFGGDWRPRHQFSFFLSEALQLHLMLNWSGARLFLYCYLLSLFHFCRPLPILLLTILRNLISNGTIKASVTEI